MSDRSVIRVVDVSKRFTIRKDNSLKERLVNSGRHKDKRQDFWALKDVNIDVQAGHTMGLIGANGSGKSTLLKMIGGILTPTSGYVERRGRLAALLELGAGFHGDLTGRENVYLNASILGLTQRQTDQYFTSIVDFSGIGDFIDTQVKFYSSGMYVRLAFAVAVHVNPDILLIDEVLAVGDEPFQRKCLDRIKAFQQDGRTIILVTHSLDQVRAMCDRVVLLEHGQVIVDGTPNDAVRHFRDASSAAEQQQQNETVHDVTISNVRIGAAADGVVRSGGPMYIEYDVTSDQRVEDWSVGIALLDANGMTVYGTNTFLRDMTLSPLQGSQSVRFDFDTVPLAEGQYFLSVAVHPTMGPDYHRIDRAATVQVRSDARDAGLLAMNPTIRIESAGKTAGRTFEGRASR